MVEEKVEGGRYQFWFKKIYNWINVECYLYKSAVLTQTHRCQCDPHCAWVENSVVRWMLRKSCCEGRMTAAAVMHEIKRRK